VALFFDRRWFDSQLGLRGLNQVDLARSAGLSAEDLGLMFKDQMEVTTICVKAWAILLGHSEHGIAIRCGIATPSYRQPTQKERIEQLEARLETLEAHVADLAKRLNAPP
jgi:hypothetical protein